MATAKPAKLCAVTQAAFSDVPYILDSVWRWAEFEAYRLGRVNLRSCSFTPEHATPWPFFGAYLVISSFVVFGPTFTTLCNSFGPRAAEISRWLLGLCLLLAAFDMVTFVLGEICTRLLSRAAEYTKVPPTKKTTGFIGRARAWGRTAELFSSWATRRRRALKDLLTKFSAAWTAVRAAAPAGKARLITTSLFLVFGFLFMMLPLLVVGYELLTTHWKSGICSPAHHIFQGGLQVLTFAALAVVGYGLWQRPDPPSARWQLLGITVLWIYAAIGMMLLAGSSAREATGGPYPQTYILLLAFLMLVVFAAQRLARLVTVGLDLQTCIDLQNALATTQLFAARRTDPELSRMRITSAIINGVVYHPLHLLLLPSLAALLAPPDYLAVWVGVFTLIALMLLAHGSISPRWEELISIVRRWFLTGTPLLVSVAVITLAILRVLDVQYVSTIMDAAPIGVITMLILGAYMTLWFFEYWINRWIAEQLLWILGAPDRGRSGCVPYLFPGSPPGPSAVLPRGRVITLQGPGEFCVQGCLQRANPLPGEEEYDFAFNIYRLTDLINRLAPGSKATNELLRRVKTYFAIINLTLLFLGGALVYAHRWSDAPLNAYPVVYANGAAVPEAARGADLMSMLERQAAGQRPALIVAASGGGTRAALYTATALEGLAQLGRIRDIVLLSGVSGGGVALAYFASSYDHLQCPDDRAQCSVGQPCAWDRFKDLVAQPFIEDVLDGIDELRIADTVPLGQLLAESLQRRLFPAGATFGALHGPGLILNTTITGHPWSDSQILRDRLRIRGRNDSAQPFASLAGSRLIFTNLTNVDGFPHAPWPMADIGLDYKLIRDPRIPLAAAAALNANFPPVFSNARVCVGALVNGDCKGDSYYVTDGGATENLGLVSALYELRGVLAVWQQTQPKSKDGKPLVPPQIDVVAIEASAITYDYTDDRGVGAATGGAKERINGGLTAELLKSIDRQLASLGAPPLRLHYLPLPTAFRSRGGFGTHWMYAEKIRVSNPLVPRLGNRFEQWLHQTIGHTSYVYLRQKEVNALWTALFDPKASFCAPRDSDSKRMRRVSQWICGTAPAWHIEVDSADLQVGAWSQLVNDLRDTVRPGVCGVPALAPPSPARRPHEQQPLPDVGRSPMPR